VAPSPLTGASVTLPSGGVPVASGTPQPTLNDYYDVRQAADGSWWMWKDTGGQSSAYSQTDTDLLTTPVLTLPVQHGDRGNGATTFRYVPSAMAPPALGSVVADNRAAVRTVFSVSARAVAFGATVAYQTIGLYGGGPGGAYNAARPAETDHGRLWYSTDAGKTRRAYAVTSGGRAFPIGSKWYDGRTTKLKRNMWFRWTSLDPVNGDLFTRPWASGWIKVTVTPVVTAKVKASGASRIVYGAASRVGGTAYLYKLVGKRYVKLAATKLTSKGVFTFGKRKLARGTYRVVTLADLYAGVGAKAFKV
jgi:hypothetical protein